MSRIDELAAIARKPRRTVVGLMSGTSLDGVDAALCEIGGSGREATIEVRAFQTTPFPEGLRERIERVIGGGSPGGSWAATSRWSPRCMPTAR